LKKRPVKIFCQEQKTYKTVDKHLKGARWKIISFCKMNANTWAEGRIGALLMASVYFAQPIRCRG